MNGLGSVTALTDENGVVKTTYAYDPFGHVAVSGEASDNPFQYTGRENDGTGLYYYRARYYSPELQRFISEDPLGFEGGDLNLYSYTDSVGKPPSQTNLYQYALNNPVNLTDPLGLDPIIPYGVPLPDGASPFQQPGEVNSTLRCHVNPHRDPEENFKQAVILGSMVSIVAPEFLFARGSGLLNSGQYLRIGWSRFGNQRVFRIGGEWIEKIFGRHSIDLWKRPL
jgi:RHS repeat-associated protein